jgi:thiamine biosynthesis lipoprotein
MKLDLGGIAKGFAIDLAIEAVKDANCAGAMVDAGGDVRVFGKPPRGQQYWSVGLQDPAAARQTPDSGELLMVFRLKNEAVATSGDYQRFELIGGQRYSHIIDTATGKGAGGFSSVSVIAEEATTADALATAVSVLGIEKGLSFIESMDGVEAAVLGKGKTEVVFSDGARKFIRN